jgi:hypothetical protein
MMPTGPYGEKHSADVIGVAVMVAQIATGEIAEQPKLKSGRTGSGRAGVKKRAEVLSREERSKIAKKAAAARFK